MKITDEEREVLTKYLPTGYAATIATQLGVTTNTVYNTKTGAYFNKEVADALFALALKNQRDMKREIKRLSKSMKQLSKEAA